MTTESEGERSRTTARTTTKTDTMTTSEMNAPVTTTLKTSKAMAETKWGQHLAMPVDANSMANGCGDDARRNADNGKADHDDDAGGEQ